MRHSTFLGKVLCGDGRILIQLFCHSSSSFSSDHHHSSTIPSTSIYLFVRVRRAHQTHYRDTRYLPRITSLESELSSYPLFLAVRCVFCHNICLESSLVQVPRLCVHCGTVRQGALGTEIPSTRTPNTSTANIAGEKLGSQLISRLGASLKPSPGPKYTDKAFSSN